MKKQHQQGLPGNPMLFLALLLICAISCSKKDLPAENESQGPDASTIKDYLASKGLDANTVVFEKDRVIVEQDIMITLSELAQRIAADKAPATEQRRNTYIVSNTYNQNITFYIESAVPTAWRTAIQGAVNNWNAVNGTRLGMSIISSTSANCRIFMGNQQASWIARAYLPASNGRPGVSIEINAYYNSLAASQKLFAITHEMGHTIGFHHTNQTSGTHIPGTPTSDANSVMNSFVLPWNGFTAGDVLATQILYPQ